MRSLATGSRSRARPFSGSSGRVAASELGQRGGAGQCAGMVEGEVGGSPGPVRRVPAAGVDGMTGVGEMIPQCVPVHLLGNHHGLSLQRREEQSEGEVAQVIRTEHVRTRRNGGPKTRGGQSIGCHSASLEGVPAGEPARISGARH
jgi:hypothetical protein